MLITIYWLVPLSFYGFLLLQELVPTLLTLLLKGFSYIEMVPACIFCSYMSYCCVYKTQTRKIVLISLDGLFLLLMLYYLVYVVPMVLQLWWAQYFEYTSTGTLEVPPLSLTKYYISLLFVLFVGRTNCMQKRVPLKKRTPTPLKKGGSSKIPSTSRSSSTVQTGQLNQGFVERTAEATLPVAIGVPVTVGADRFLTHGPLGASKPTGPAWLGLAGKKLAATAIGALAAYGVYSSLSESGKRVTLPKEYPGLTDKASYNPDIMENDLLSSQPVNNLNTSASGFIDKVVKESGNQSPKFKLDEVSDFPPF